MDEPESALSPQSQMRLLSKIHALAKDSKFIIVTHSPILLSYYDGQILNADNDLKPIAYKDTEIYSIYRHFLECPEKCKSIYLMIKYCIFENSIYVPNNPPLRNNANSENGFVLFLPLTASESRFA